MSSPLPSKEVAELKETSNIQNLKQDALAKQRPSGFEPPKSHKRVSAREGLELMGVENIDDEEDDLGCLGWPDRY
jgi:hypothetical protein